MRGISVLGVDGKVHTLPHPHLPSFSMRCWRCQCQPRHGNAMMHTYTTGSAHHLPRGCSQHPAALQVWVWLSQFLMLPLLYFSTSFGADVNAWAFPGGPVPSGTLVYLLTLASVLFAFCLAYAALYGSDPGFLDSHQRQASAEQTAVQQLQLRGASACAYCGCIPTTRSKHSKGSGQCVHKFDHFCWWLSTDIGASCPRPHSACCVDTHGTK